MHPERTTEAAGGCVTDDRARPAGRLGNLENTMSHAGESTPEPFSQAARDRLVRLAFRLVWNRDDAEDVVQESLTVAHARDGQLRGPDKWWSWLRRIVIHRCHTAGRDKVRRRRLGERLAARRNTAADQAPASESGELTELIRGALPNLPARQREVVVLRHLEGLSYEEIGEVLEIAPATARVHARAGLEALRMALVNPRAGDRLPRLRP
jgi:RNA polymerase sigma-70 factor (ECF subfamily)